MLGITYHTLQAYLRVPIHEPVPQEAWRDDGPQELDVEAVPQEV